MTIETSEALERIQIEQMIRDGASYDELIGAVLRIPYEGEREPIINLIAEARGLESSLIKKDLKKNVKANIKKKNEPNYIAMFPGLVDIVEDSENPCFMIADGDNLQLSTHHEIDGEVFEPPPKENLQWLLPRAEEVLKYYQTDSDNQLYYDLVEYHKSISELPSENYYQLLALWDIHTYLIDKFQYSPYIWLYAIPERGKSRTGKGSTYVSFRCIDMECMREANLIRYAQDLGASLFIDTLDLWRKAERNGTEDFLLKRFEKGATVARVLYPEKGAHKDMKHFKIYGATMIATNEPISEILASRAIQIVMPESSRRYEQDVLPEMGLPLKERLTAFRARYMNETLPDADKPTRRRLGDILRPLGQVVKLVCPEQERLFMELVHEIQRERKESLGETIESKIIGTLLELKEEFDNGMLGANEVGDHLNEGLPDRFKRSQSYYTRKMKAMGIELRRINGTKVIWDPDLFKNLAIRYLPESVQSVFSVQGIEKTEENDGHFGVQKFPDVEKCTGNVQNEKDQKSNTYTQKTEKTENEGVSLPLTDGVF